ncbi:CcdB family protein [Sphingomonas sp. KR1UV-12]|uniref:Toxin CcdB n=1 Tax=Sphingomonas aurea TaxID=3063994 RepID=A0ABT9EPF0_9SPHN|nr:CcdB family protein [Sphingomonas sp. KR1UV-12]MDP1028681.1 CcdB family protein [Sphingomonas sp. KR1UV-12]
MAQFDVYRTRDNDLLIDCQSEAFGHLKTRLAAPLTPMDRSPPRQVRLNPIFDIDGEQYMMITQFAGAINASEFRTRVTSLAAYRFDIIGAFDVLMTGV